MISNENSVYKDHNEMPVAPKDDQQARMKILSVRKTMDQEALLHIAE